MTRPAYAAERVTPLLSEQLHPYLATAFRSAACRIWAVVFFADVRLFEDPRRLSRTLIQDLAYAAWRGIDARLLLSPTNAEDIELGNGTSACYAARSGIDVRWFASPVDDSTHSKFVVVDADLSVVGSHNWTDGGLDRNIEASVAVRSADFTTELADQFLEVWETSAPVEVA